jgi:hypothetical protein
MIQGDMRTGERRTTMALIAALAIGCTHCGARSSIESPESGAGGGGPAQPSSCETTADASAWTPRSLAGLVLWLDGTKGVQTSGGAVTSWEDQSGLANDATPSAPGSSAPALVANAIGGAPAVRFDGASRFVIPDDPSLQFGTGDFVVAVVARHTTPSDVGWGYGLLYIKYQVAFPFTGPALVANYEEGSTQIAAQLVYHQAVIGTAQEGLNDGQPRSLVMRRRAAPGLASLELRLNGETSATSTGSAYAIDVSAPGRPVFVGGTPDLQDIVGDIAEVVAVNGATSDADVAALECYLEAKYGL